MGAHTRLRNINYFMITIQNLGSVIFISSIKVLLPAQAYQHWTSTLNTEINTGVSIPDLKILLISSWTNWTIVDEFISGYMALIQTCHIVIILDDKIPMIKQIIILRFVIFYMHLRCQANINFINPNFNFVKYPNLTYEQNPYGFWFEISTFWWIEVKQIMMLYGTMVHIK